MTPPIIAIDLAAKRTIVIRQADDHAFTFTLRRVDKDDWFHYFDGVRVTSETRGRELVRTVDAGEAAVRLVEDLLVDVSGYPLPEGIASITEVPDWQQKIPMRHRLGVSEVLMDARSTDPGEAVPVFGQERVALDCLWSADEQGRICRHCCYHIFESPSADHYKQYMAAISTSRVVGGSRAGKTIHAGAQKTLCALYDELIVETHGYGVSGTPLEGRAQILQWMDCRHKVAAAERLFAADEAETEE